MRAIPLKYTLFPVFLLLWPVAAQTVTLDDLLHFRQYHAIDGLASEEVSDLTQDHNGFLWIAGKGGLQRFDGRDFRSYPLGDGESQGSPDLTALCAELSAHDTLLWIGSRKGLYMMELTSERIRFFPVNAADSTGSGAHVHALLLSNDGTLWIGLRAGGLARMVERPSPANNFQPRFKFYLSGTGDNHLSNNFVRRLYQDTQGNIWIATSFGLSVFNPRLERFHNYFYKPGDPSSISSNSVFAITGDSRGRIWVSTLGGSGLQQALVDSGGRVRFKRYRSGSPDSLGHSVIFDIHVDKQDRLWLASAGGGLIRYDGRRFVHFRAGRKNTASLTSNNLFRLYEDRAGGLWVAGISDGLSHAADIYPDSFFLRQLTPENSPLRDDHIHSIVQDRMGRIWTGTEKGLFAYRLDGQHFSTLTSLTRIGGVSLRGKPVNELLARSDGTLWFSSDFSIGLGAIRPDTRKLISDMRQTNPLGLYSNSVTALFEDKAQRLWVGTFSGLALLKKERFENFIYDPNAKTTDSNPASPIITYISQQNDSTWWIGTENGLSRMSYRGEGKPHFTNFYHSARQEGTPGNNNIRMIRFDSRGVLWMLSGAGLETGFPEKGRFIFSPRARNHPGANKLINFLIDKQDKIWLSGSPGLWRYDPVDSSLRVFGREYGLPPGNYNYKALTLLSDGRLLFGSQSGLTVVDPRRLPPAEPPSNILLTGLEILNRPLKPGTQQMARSAAYNHTLNLDYDDNVITLTYAAPDFKAASDHIYTYKLEGFDAHWIKAGRRRSVQYTNLDPGTYRFHVKASLPGGKQSAPRTLLTIHVAPPLWQTWWARMLYALAFFGLLAGIRRYERNKEKLEHRLQREKLQSEKWREIDRAKNTFFTNISHEFRTPLTLIIAPLQQMLEQEEGRDKKRLSNMLRQARRLLNLVNQLLEISRISSGKIRLRVSRRDAVAEARGIFHSFGSFAEQKDIESVFDSSQDSFMLWYDSEKFEQILINLISNAYKFTRPGGRVTLRIHPAEDSKKRPCLVFRVSDNGPGFTPEEQQHIFDRYYRAEETENSVMGSGVGLALVKQLTEAHGGEIRVESKPGQGASFAVYLPCGRDHIPDRDIVSGREEPPPFAEPAAAERMADLNEEQAPGLLLVEDTPEVRDYIREIFAGAYRITTAADGHSGLKTARADVPDIIISDVMMPGMNGYELCAAIKSDPLTNHIPLILLTARAGDEDRYQGLQTGADAYVPKPFNPRELKLRVRKLLEQRRLLQEKFSRRLLDESPSAPVALSGDEQFIEQATRIVLEHLEDAAFNVQAFASEMALSRMQLHRKIKALTGKSTTEFIRVIRLREAAALLEKKSGNVSEVAFAVGFNNLSYFVRSFQKQYGVSPSQYGSR